MKSISTLRLFIVLTAMFVSYGLSAQTDSAVWTNTTKVPTGLPKSAFDSGSYSTSRLTADSCTYVRLGVAKTLKPKVATSPFDNVTYSMREFAPTDTSGVTVAASAGIWEANPTATGDPTRYLEFAIHATSNLYVTGIKAPMVSSGGAAISADIYYSTDNFATSNLLVLGKNELLSKDTFKTFNLTLPDVAITSGQSFKVRLLVYYATKAAASGKLFGFEDFVIYANTTPMPVSFGGISANLINKESLVNWSAENEINTSSYSVEKSINGSSFKEIGTVNASKRINYSFTDANPTNGVNYYRIKAIDNNGAVLYSSVVKVLNQTLSGITVFPNPIIGRKLNVQIDGVSVGHYTLNVYSVTGQRVSSTPLTLNSSSLSQSLLLPSSIKAGTYELELSNGVSRVTKTISVQ